MSIWGYCRISTKHQNIERQIRNIKDYDPNAVIIEEVFTGTKFNGRKEFDKLLKRLKQGDTIIFDSVSRMSRNAEEGFELYEKLYSEGISLVFLNEHHIDTDVYKKALEGSVAMTGTNADYILEGVNKYLMALAKEQIRITFEQAEKEVADLHKRTREGMQTARFNGKQIGAAKGTKFTTKKSISAKKQIRKYNKDFGGSLNNEETWKLIGISKMTFYKYKSELIAELNQ